MSTDAKLEVENLILDAIEAAEAIPDPLAGLAEQTATNPGAPFKAEALEALAALKQDNRAAFEALRSQLKKAGCRVTALDDALAEENGDAGGRGPTQADILIDLAQSVALFHTPDGSGYADRDINGHRETWPIRAKGFRRWLARRFFEEGVNAGDLDVFDTVVTPDVVYAGATVGDESGLVALKRIYGEALTGLPGIQYGFLTSVASEDTVAVRYLVEKGAPNPFRESGNGR